ncbi:alpha-D-ribose 1-methylphosphonate 5-triphosphate diphosphatase [Pelagibius litoralis]|uniref:Alpha-D-ribose 1-methylphosphonate 5-triphosphate diphosphatase n=1 Tax=Pelagibius litoralis TaxID=374515 RepID=A0A967F264_9PROT|nr:alpha-D-ribose 1-methylphosphonate 5-triphosphate diphosphatase [Pelagibius litoralis]NIA71801.1 alpha-D-ribose 1-methylphosphonate 5-triphosphate diphosphatase [Pelagibius litoralis]
MSVERVISNARLVLEEEVVHGNLVIKDGRIAGIASGATAVAAAEDMAGDYVLPGLIDLHTDHFEKHVLPRPGTHWDPVAAIMAHDAQMAGGGVTTAYDCVCVGVSIKHPERKDILRPMIDAVREARDKGMLRSDHIVHLRCEVTDEEVVDLFDSVADHAAVGMMSLMDHAPGHRQYPNVQSFRERTMKNLSLSEAEADGHIERLTGAQHDVVPRNRAELAERGRARGLAIASHDDETEAHVEDAAAMGITVSEFPTTAAAARKARAHGMHIVMGAPNLIRGGSHSGNVSAAELSEERLLDNLASDYVPAAMLQAAFRLTQGPHGLALPAAVCKVTANPARAAGLDDRGRLAPGLRADLLRVAMVDDKPHVRTVWRDGKQVM